MNDEAEESKTEAKPEAKSKSKARYFVYYWLFTIVVNQALRILFGETNIAIEFLLNTTGVFSLLIGVVVWLAGRGKE